MLDKNLEKPWWALRLAFGVVPIVAGFDKFTHLLTDWNQYLSPLVERVLPFSTSTFMQVVGVIEIGAGVLVLSKLTRIGGYVVSAWLTGIAINLLTTGQYFDIAVRDLTMAVGAFALAKMSEVRERATQSERQDAKAFRMKPSATEARA